MIFLPPGGGRAYEVGGMRGVIKADGDESAHALCFSEWELVPGADGPPLHMHREHQEAFYVVEGTVTFTVAEEEVEAPVGSFLMIPAGTMHTFANRAERPARCVNAYVPGGFEQYFRRGLEMMRAPEPPDPDAMRELSAQADVFFAER
jgi:mannose-6-phosphate isomerase-like protein (cupin superfamily)